MVASTFIFMIFQGALSMPSGESEVVASTEPPPKTAYINRTWEIENITLQIDESLMEKHIRRLQNFESRYSYNVPYNYRASEYIYSVFKNNGLNVSYDYFSYNTWDMRNVVAELPGKTRPDDIYIICSHMDSTSGNAYVASPGADDNASGTSGVLAAAEVLSDYEFNATIRFITFSGEEQYLKGSQHYMNEVWSAGENILGVINLDMIGYNPEDRGNYVRLCEDTDDAGASDSLIAFTNQTAQKYEYIHGIKTDDTVFGNSDHAVFAPNYPALMLLETAPMNPNYHGTGDLISALNMTYAANVTQVAVATLAELAELNSTDIQPPAYHHPVPAPGSRANASPQISIELSDPAGLDITNMAMVVDGNYVAPAMTPSPLGLNLTHTPPTAFPDSTWVSVRVMANDTRGHYLDYNWTFVVDARSPEPPPDFRIELTRSQFEKQGLVMDRGDTGEPDDTHVLSPSVMFLDGEYKMWYTGHDGSAYQICYANSTDGINWTRYGIVLPKGELGDYDSVHAAFASVIYDSGQYKMWYSGKDGSSWRILYATSPDGISWTKQGLAIDLGAYGEPDDVLAYTPSVLKTTEYEMWYTGRDGYTERILYANSSDGLNWSKHGIVVDMDYKGAYDHQRAISPNVLYVDGQYEMYYSGFDGEKYRILKSTSPDGLTWNKSGIVVDVGDTGSLDYASVRHGAVVKTPTETKIWYSGLNIYWRLFYANLTGAENKTDIQLSWPASPSGDVTHYEIFRADSLSSFNMSQPYRKVNNTVFVDAGCGDDNPTNYYYRIRAVDGVGNYGQASYTAGKIGQSFDAGWGLMSNPFLTNDTPLDIAFSSVKWGHIMYYDNTDAADPWKSNKTGRLQLFNDIHYMNNTMAAWVKLEKPDCLAVTGVVTNVSIELLAGWNFVAYPYHEPMQVQDALAGVPYDRVEGNNQSQPYWLESLGDTDMMLPGRGYWIHLTATYTWDAINT